MKCRMGNKSDLRLNHGLFQSWISEIYRLWRKEVNIRWIIIRLAAVPTTILRINRNVLCVNILYCSLSGYHIPNHCNKNSISKNVYICNANKDSIYRNYKWDLRELLWRHNLWSLSWRTRQNMRMIHPIIEINSLKRAENYC